MQHHYIVFLDVLDNSNHMVVIFLDEFILILLITK
jgi:hypothetical protein